MRSTVRGKRWAWNDAEGAEELVGLKFAAFIYRTTGTAMSWSIVPNGTGVYPQAEGLSDSLAIAKREARRYLIAMENA